MIAIVYNVADRATFEAIESKILPQVKEHTEDKTVYLLIGNKNDLTSSRVVSYEEGQILAQKHGMMFIETSAKESDQRSALIEKLKEAADKYRLNRGD